jgi:hypothetical protein
MESKSHKQLELAVYKEAVWDYLLDHSDILEEGVMFVKFHTASREEFESHVKARAKGYHRNNPVEKEKLLLSKKYNSKKIHTLFKQNLLKSKSKEEHAMKRIRKLENQDAQIEIEKGKKKLYNWKNRQKTFFGRIVNRFIKL